MITIGQLLKVDPTITKYEIEVFRKADLWGRETFRGRDFPCFGEYEIWAKVKATIDKVKTDAIL